MRFSERKHANSCSGMQGHKRRASKNGWIRYILPVAGLVSLIWFLIRVIPKPSRALYPCQRMAFPIASGFVAWIIGLGAWGLAFRKMKVSLAHRRYLLAVLCSALSVGALWVTMIATSEDSAIAEPQAANAPMGTARGINPGRVVWVHDPDATNWDGPGNGHLWEAVHTDQKVCDEMVSSALRSLTGKATDKQAWDALFRHYNKIRGKGDVGYKTGEKISIKVNFVGFIRTHGGVNPQTYALEDWVDYMNTSPQMIAALLGISITFPCCSMVTLSEVKAFTLELKSSLIRPDSTA